MRSRYLRRYSAFLRLAAAFLLSFATAAMAAEDPAAALAARYQALRAQLESNAFGVPLTVESVEEDGLKRGEAYGVLAQPFAALSQALNDPHAWCEIALLHLNIKTCTHERRDGEWLTFYSGRKFYEPPEKAYALRYAFHIESTRADYLAVMLTADSGPLGTRDYRIGVEAIPLGPQTFLHFRYAYRPSLVSSVATTSYLATLGSGKVGFTITGYGRDGKPEYVGGVRGIVERNAVRYYLAIQAYLEAPAPGNYEQRLARWYDLTERYATQLHELERAEYLQYKRQERQQQLARQQALDAGGR